MARPPILNRAEFEKVISGEDFLTFTPSLMLNAGSGKFLTTHMNKYSANPQNNGRRRIRSNGQSDNSPFSLQSIGANFAALYSVGKFTIEPQLYLDYYLQSTTSNKFTEIYNIIFSFSF